MEGVYFGYFQMAKHTIEIQEKKNISLNENRPYSIDSKISNISSQSSLTSNGEFTNETNKMLTFGTKSPVYYNRTFNQNLIINDNK